MAAFIISGYISRIKGNLGDILIARELPIAAGRILGFVMYISVSIFFAGLTPVKIILPLLASIVVVNYFYIRGITLDK